MNFQIVTNVGEVVQSVWRRSVVHHFTINQQSQSVEQFVDRVSRLVDGHNYGPSVTGHSEKTHS